VNAVTQDGYASAELSGVRIDGNGVLNGVFTNGQTKAVGQVAVARFRSNDGLGRAGQNLWIATRESGDAAMGVAGSGGRGAIVSGALEQSNVDVTAQFVELISRQRSFQANSKTITTADQMLETIQQLVR
jgi:flagellar hook protein FlgE